MFPRYGLCPDQLPVARLRDQLSFVSSNDYQPNLWQEGIPHCTSQNSSDVDLSNECFLGGTTFNDIDYLLRPYLAELPSGYQTGLIPQYMPRINSSISYDILSTTEFPQACDTIAGGYYIQYTANMALPAHFGATTLENMTVLDVQIYSMPFDLSQSLWKAIRDRQDITEEMFMNITFGTSTVTKATFTLVVNSTLGYFELPKTITAVLLGLYSPNIPILFVKTSKISAYRNGTQQDRFGQMRASVALRLIRNPIKDPLLCLP